MSDTPDPVNIEDIMQQIRQQILTQKAEETGDETAALIPTHGDRFPFDFYDHLYQAGLSYNQIRVPINVTKSNIPLIGGLIDKLRYKLHEVVLFYVNQVAERQAQVNTHTLRALSLLSETLDNE